MKLILLLTALVLLLTSAQAEEALYVRKVENLPEDFIFGMDVSSVLALESSGVTYHDFDGAEADLFRILADNGYNYIRVRVWNNPFDVEGHGYGGGNCDISTALTIGQRATANGMRLLVDFHYSDFWADPSKQMVPLAWQDMDIDAKADALYRYTLDCLTLLKDAGVDVGMVQIGNETNGGLCGETDWRNICRLMNTGARAVREVLPDAKVAVHFTNPESVGRYAGYAAALSRNGVDYDVFASSYYPFWHGTLENLITELNGVTAAYGKPVMIAETSYAYTLEDTDFSSNSVGEGAYLPYPATVQGQANALRDVVDTVVNGLTDGIGVFYWEGAWIAVGTEGWAQNHALWEQYGSGWASSYAGVYDPRDAGQYYGGSAVDNQAFFDENGMPLASLRVIPLMRTGSDAPIKADAIDPVTVICDLNVPLALPETVRAVMSDNSRRDIPVTWHITPEMDAAMHAGGPAQYVVTGTAGGMETRCEVSMVEYNYLADYSFEEGGRGWVLTDLGKTQQLGIEDKASDSLTGTKHVHFWSAAKNSVEFTVEQTVADLPAGKFAFTVSIMGGDGGQTDIYAYVKVNGETVATAPMQITSWNNWHTAVTPAFTCEAGQEVAVGVYVRCQGAGNGAWGKIDDAMLNSVR